MLVSEVDIRKVRVAMRDRFMHMLMGVGFISIPRKSMGMLVMSIMPMRVIVFNWMVGMNVLMSLNHVQPQSGCHCSKT